MLCPPSRGTTDLDRRTHRCLVGVEAGSGGAALIGAPTLGRCHGVTARAGLLARIVETTRWVGRLEKRIRGHWQGWSSLWVLH